MEQPKIEFGGIYYFKYKEKDKIDYKLMLLYDYDKTMIRGYDLHFLFYMDETLAYSAYKTLNNYSGTETFKPKEFVIDVLMNHPVLDLDKKIKNVGDIKDKKTLNTMERLNSSHRMYSLQSIIGKIKSVTWNAFKSKAKQSKGD